MNHEHLLPIGAAPIMSYEHHASPLTVISQSNAYSTWLYSNFVQLECEIQYPVKGDVGFNFLHNKHIYFNCPHLDYLRMSSTYVKHFNRGIVPFLIESVQQGYYPNVFLNHFYCPFEPSYQKYHYWAAFLVYGFNETERIFHILGYADGHYSAKTISFSDVELAFEYNDDSPVYKTMIKLFKYVPHVKDELDLPYIRRSLESYMASDGTIYPSRSAASCEPLVVGLECYNIVKQYLEKMLDRTKKVDVRPIHLLWEHKKLWVERLRYFQQQGIEISETSTMEMESLEKRMLTTRNLMIKLRITNNYTILAKIVEGWDSVIDEDVRCLSQVYEDLIKNEH
ncbi:hypothetical protein [Paenibacillus sp. YYML68]|uniref:hypothetical protein n=1 Tax=Paenibacillus sp. YYML68 TaxID=2909250 RepID=UPI002490176B|nr:hypothetical protein [Paenibacillus sp. YYML68]